MICLSFFISCTEKVSDDVKPENLSTEEKTKANYENKAIRLVDKNRKDLSFILHKAGTMSSPCELTAPTNGFSSLTYDKTSKLHTVDCILDAQELDIYFQGVQLQFQADEFLCEYVKYKPYRFFQFQPGSSSKRSITINCDETCSATGSEFRKYCNKTFKTINTYALPDDSGGEGVDISAVLADIDTSSTITEDNPLTCEFDYSKDHLGHEGPNCDEGFLKDFSYNLKSIEIDNGSCDDGTSNSPELCAANNAVWTAVLTNYCNSTEGASLSLNDKTLTECNGSWNSCLAGAGVDVLSDQKFRSLLMENQAKEYFEYDINIEAPIRKGYVSNLYVNNFSRTCSSTGEAKTQAKYDTSLFNIIGHEVEDMPYNNSKLGYSIDQNQDGTTDFFAGGIHPFNVLNYGFHIKPYYAFECIDAAEDVKAQIRLFIREWDKEFDSTNPYIARLSDVNQTNSLMDGEGDQVFGEEWNDQIDWDDIFADWDRNKDNGYDSAFLQNQCTSLTLGHCTDRTYVDEVSCITANKAVNRWVMEDYCTNSVFSTYATCIGGGAEWITINRHSFGGNSGLFPNWRM